MLFALLPVLAPPVASSCRLTRWRCGNGPNQNCAICCSGHKYSAIWTSMAGTCFTKDGSSSARKNAQRPHSILVTFQGCFCINVATLPHLDTSVLTAGENPAISMGPSASCEVLIAWTCCKRYDSTTVATMRKMASLVEIACIVLLRKTTI